MTLNGSYDISSFSTSIKAEIRRLNAQVDIFWPVESALLLRFGLRDGMDVLDCGCGTGRMIELLKGEMPQLRCTGLETDPRLAEAAAFLISDRGLTDCTIVLGSAEQPDLRNSSFDFIILRLVLEHLPEPLPALRSLKRLLRPGGKLAVIANDFEFHLRTWPPVPQLDRLYEAYCRSRKKDGGDPCIGRRLPQLFVQAGLNVAGYEIEVAHNAMVGDTPFLNAEGAGIPAQLVRTGFLDEKALEEMIREWKSMLDTPGHSIMRQLFICIGTWTGVTDVQVPNYISDSIGVTERVEFRSLSNEEKYSGILEVLLDLVAKALDLQHFVAEDRLVDLGIDSLAALELQESIKSVMGVEIQIAKLLENMSIVDLARDIDSEQARRVNRPQAIKTPPAQERTIRWEEGEI